MVELLGEAVGEGEDLVALGDGEGAAGHKVGLEVDKKEGGSGLVDLHESFKSYKRAWGTNRLARSSVKTEVSTAQRTMELFAV